MAVIYEVHFGLLLQSEIPEDFAKVGDDWNSTLKSKRAKIIENLQRVVPDEDAYLSKIVDRSNKGYAEFIGTGHERYDEIMVKREIKMTKAKSDYITNRNNAFAEGGDFEKGVDANKEAFKRNAVVTWMVTGDRDKIYGAIPKLKYALRGKKALLEGVITSDKDHLITSTELKPFFKYPRYVPSVVASCNKWLTHVAYAVLAGWSDDDINNKIASKGNAELAGFINSSMLNPDLDPANCKLEIKKDATTGRWGIYFVEATPA